MMSSLCSMRSRVRSRHRLHHRSSSSDQAGTSSRWMLDDRGTTQTNSRGGSLANTMGHGTVETRTLSGQVNSPTVKRTATKKLWSLLKVALLTIHPRSTCRTVLAMCMRVEVWVPSTVRPPTSPRILRLHRLHQNSTTNKHPGSIFNVDEQHLIHHHLLLNKHNQEGGRRQYVHGATLIRSPIPTKSSAPFKLTSNSDAHPDITVNLTRREETNERSETRIPSITLTLPT